MNTILNSSNNIPKTISYALYVNGIYVPAAGAQIQISKEEIICNFSLAPTQEIMRLGENDRLHFAFFIKDPVTGEYVLFVEGEIIGIGQQITSQSAFVTLTGRSFKNSLDVPMTSVVGDPASLKEMITSLSAPIFTPASMMLLMGFSGASYTDDKIFKQIDSPFDYVQSMFALLTNSGEALKGASTKNSQSTSPEYQAIKKMLGSYIYRFANRYMYSKNLIKKHIPDPALCAKMYKNETKESRTVNFSEPESPTIISSGEQQAKTNEGIIFTKEEVPIVEVGTIHTSEYETYFTNYIRALQTMSALSGILQKFEMKDIPITGMVQQILSLFDVAAVPMNLPPLIKLTRTGFTSDKDTKGYPGRLIYSTDGKPYIGDVIYKVDNPFTVIPKSNFITSEVIELLSWNCNYINKVTRVYVYSDIDQQRFAPRAYPYSLNGIYEQKSLESVNSSDATMIDPAAFDLSFLVSREEAFKGPRREIIQPHPLHLYAILVKKDPNQNAEVVKEIDDLTQEYLFDIEKLNKNNSRMILLDRFVVNRYHFLRSSTYSCTITMPFNPYLIPTYPVVFVDKKFNNHFIGIINSISYTFNPESASTTVYISNAMPLQEYLAAIAESTEEEHPDFRTPAPFYIPNVDKLTQTYEEASKYFGMMFYRHPGSDSIIKLEDIFRYSDGEELSLDINPVTGKNNFTTKLRAGTYKAIDLKKMLAERTIVQKDIYGADEVTIMGFEEKIKNINDISIKGVKIIPVAELPGTKSYVEYLRYIQRPGITLDEYVNIHIIQSGDRQYGLGYPEYKNVIVDIDKPLKILEFKFKYDEDVNETEEGLTYANTQDLLIGYTAKILSKTPESLIREDYYE